MLNGGLRGSLAYVPVLMQPGCDFGPGWTGLVGWRSVLVISVSGRRRYPYTAGAPRRQCRGNGRFPYTGTTGGPAKIIASGNGCMDLSRTWADARPGRQPLHSV